LQRVVGYRAAKGTAPVGEQMRVGQVQHPHRFS
jgi:hypothetical protein